MKNKKESKVRSKEANNDPVQAAAEGGENGRALSSRSDLHAFLLNVRDKMEDGSAAPVYALSAMNFVMSNPKVYDWLDKETKEMARDIWLRLKQAGLQLHNPPLLFGEEGESKSD